MATRIWLGNAAAVSQVTEATVDALDTDDVISLTINGKTVAFTSPDGDESVAAIGLAAAFNAATAGEFAEITATAESDVITLTGDTAGVPFEVTASGLTLETVTAATGPNHWDNAANWSGGSVPESSDDVYLTQSQVSILYGLDQSAVTLSKLSVAASFSGTVGLPAVNENGYREYRETTLQIGATNLEVGRGEGGGSGRLRLDTGSVQTTLNVYQTAEPLDFGQPAVSWIGSHASNSLSVYAGKVGVAVGSGNSATLSAVRVTGGELFIGEDVTLGSLEVTGGANGIASVELWSSLTSLTQSGGDVRLRGTAAITTANLEGGRLANLSSGTITAITLAGDDAELDFSGDARARTVTDCTLTRGQILDPHGAVTWTNGIQPGGILVAG